MDINIAKGRLQGEGRLIWTLPTVPVLCLLYRQTGAAAEQGRGERGTVFLLFFFYRWCDQTPALLDSKSVASKTQFFYKMRGRDNGYVARA